MALPSPRAFPLLCLLIPLFSFEHTAMGGIVGVDYGRMANNLMPPEKVVELLKANSIGYVSIYDADPTVLRAFCGSGIKVTVTLPNNLLQQAAWSTAFAAGWVRDNVSAYIPATEIQAIAVGNEVFRCCPNLAGYLVPAMRNIADAVASQGLDCAVKVSTPVAFDAVVNSSPPSDGTFREDLQPVMREMLDLLSSTGSYLMINIDTYHSYVSDSNIALDYALGRAREAVVDPKTGRCYDSLFDAQLDAVYSAMARLGFGNAVASTMQSGGRNNKAAEVKETGWPKTKGRPPPRSARTTAADAAKPTRKKAAYDGSQNASLAERSDAATVENARAYNTNLIQRILAGKTGTPLHPDADIDVYIFALFDENQKDHDPTERSYGLFYPNGRKAYDFSFRGKGVTPTPVGPLAQQTWCVADAAVGKDRLRAALDRACGPGKVDCSPIQPGAACFDPATLEAHATYAFNSYYQQRGRCPGACNFPFQGAAKIVTQAPETGNCHLSP